MVVALLRDAAETARAESRVTLDKAIAQVRAVTDVSTKDWRWWDNDHIPLKIGRSLSVGVNEWSYKCAFTNEFSLDFFLNIHIIVHNALFWQTAGCPGKKSGTTYSCKSKLAPDPASFDDLFRIVPGCRSAAQAHPSAVTDMCSPSTLAVWNWQGDVLGSWHVEPVQQNEFIHTGWHSRLFTAPWLWNPKKIEKNPISSPSSIAWYVSAHRKGLFWHDRWATSSFDHGANIAVKPSPLTTPEEIVLVGEGERLGHVHGKGSWKAWLERTRIYHDIICKYEMLI